GRAWSRTAPPGGPETPPVRRRGAGTSRDPRWSSAPSVSARPARLAKPSPLGKADARRRYSAMRVDLFDFELPPELIAQHPVRRRDAARLLGVRQAPFEYRHVRDLPQLLRQGDLLVFNDTRVIPARLVGRRGAARIEVTLHQPVRGAEDARQSRW